MTNGLAKTYKVIDTFDGGCLNHVTRGDGELDVEDNSSKEKKRRDRAVVLMNRWISTVYHDAKLAVVEA